MLGEFAEHRRVFIEVTKTAHKHGGPGWEFGSCLWSPSRNKKGADSYALMRAAQAGDLVLHILEDEWEPRVTEHRFAGRSFAAGSHETVAEEPPSPGDWANQAPYYQVPLHEYEALQQSISLTAFAALFDHELRRELSARPAHYPFTLYGHGNRVQLRQGGYINICTPGLFALVQTVIGERLPPGGDTRAKDLALPSADQEYKETKRLTAERHAFARNPALVREARRLRGYTCEACDFNFEAIYGPLGKDYIECHHVDPLGRRDRPTTSTRVRDVRMLCANCHRMVHRRVPPLKVEDLRAILGLPARAQRASHRG